MNFDLDMARKMIIENKWYDGRKSNDFEQYWPGKFGFSRQELCFLVV
jgi:hypothetical protein